jgi:predicted nucleic acid-binding protein
MSVAVRACFFDASALVKVYAQEDGSEVVKPFFDGSPTKYTTPFCFYEALGVLKVKWQYRKELTHAEYIAASLRLTTWYGASSSRINDIDFTSYEALPMIREIISKYQIDASDAFQLVSVKNGYFSRMILDSKTIFVTADAKLAEVAKLENLRVWYIFDGSPP